MKKKLLDLKPTIKMLTFQLDFCLKSIPDGFSASEFREVSISGNAYDFSINFNSIDKSDILNIHKYLMSKNNTKKGSALLNKCLLYY